MIQSVIHMCAVMGTVSSSYAKTGMRDKLTKVGTARVQHERAWMDDVSLKRGPVQQRRERFRRRLAR